MDSVRIPAYYVLSRKCTPENLVQVLRVLSITPVHCVIVDNIQDAHLGRDFSELILRTATEEDSITVAIRTFQDVDMPVLVIGTAELLDAVYLDGRKEQVSNG